MNTDVVREETKVLGAELENLSRDERLTLKLKSGVKISKLGSGAMKKKGIPSGFIITHIDKSPMYTTKDVENELVGKSGAVLIEGVTLEGDKEAYAIRLD
jgi:S1-C subfamily serine protease